MINLSEYRSRPRALPDYLPWACLAAPGIILNKDGSFQRTAAFRGPDLDSSTGEELVAICARINNALKRFGSNWALYFEASRNPAQNYPDSLWQDPVAWLVDEERRSLFEGRTKGEELFESDYYLTFGYLPPADSMGRLQDALIEHIDAEHVSAHDHLSRFVYETNKALDLFKDVLPKADFLSDDQTLTYLQSCISPKRQFVKTPQTPAYLDAILGGADLVGGLEPVLGGENLRVISILGFPSMTEPGLLDELNNLGFSYRWMTRYLPMDKLEATKVLTRYRRQWFAKRKSMLSLLREVLSNEATPLVDNDADNKAIDPDAALQSLGDDDVGYGYMTTAIAIHHPSANTADNMIRELERVIDGRGYVTIKESVNAVDAWLGTLPGLPYANVRQPIVHTLNLAHMMPLSAVWAGPEENVHLGGPPLLYATTASQTPFRLVTHQGDVGHTLVLGPTGAGKSVLLSLLALQFRRYKDAQVFIFDKGRSATAVTAGIGGDQFDLGGDQALCFQPLANIDEETERAWALEWLDGLLAHEGVQITPDVKETVWTALTSLASAPRKERTMTGLSALIQSNPLRKALLPYTLEGPHGALLDADTETLGTSDWQCFEMEELMNQKDLVPPVLTYLFHRLEARFDGKPTLLALDEAWVFLDNSLFASRIREWLKVLRKRNVSVFFFAQSLSDIIDCDIAPTIVESCPSRIFLPNPRATEPQQREIYRKFGLNDRQINIVGTATPKRDYYFQSRAGNRLIDLSLGPVGLSFCGAGSKQDLADIKSIITTASPNSFAVEWLKLRGLDWAADLITPETEAIQGDLLCAAQ